MVKCPRCGYENSTTSLYCDNCDYPLKNPNNPKKSNKGSWNIGMGKKIILVLGIVVIAFLLFSFVYNNTQPERGSSLNVVTSNDSSYQSSTYPYTVNIIYEGSWYAEMGDPNYLATEASTGNASYSIDCASWDRISVFAEKTDYGEGNLTIQLVRNNKVVAENTTSNESGSVSLTYNYDN